MPSEAASDEGYLILSELGDLFVERSRMMTLGDRADRERRGIGFCASARDLA